MISSGLTCFFEYMFYNKFFATLASLILDINRAFHKVSKSRSRLVIKKIKTSLGLFVSKQSFTTHYVTLIKSKTLCTLAILFNVAF